MWHVWRKGEVCTRFWWGNLSERPSHRWEDNINMDLQEVGSGCGDWIELAQDRDRWRALVSAMMNFLVVPLNPGNYSISCKFNQLASQEGLFSMK
jgi:hypothetical protein